MTKHKPAINCLIDAICKAGISWMPSLLATQVVPHSVLVSVSAMYPLPFPVTFSSSNIAELSV